MKAEFNAANSKFEIRNYRTGPRRIPNFGFRISNFPSTHPRCGLRGKGELTGGAWHPDSQERATRVAPMNRRIGVPGILSGSA
jgi:hypothetical protein